MTTPDEQSPSAPAGIESPETPHEHEHQGAPIPPSLWSRCSRCLTWIGRHEFGTLLALLLLAGGLWGFAELADEVLEGETRTIDERLLLAMH